MRILALSLAALVGTCIVGYYVGAQPADSLHVFQVAEPYQPPTPVGVPYIASAPAYAPAPMFAAHPYVPSRPTPPIGDIETTLVELAREYGKTLDAAVRDNIVSNDVAQQLTAEVGFVLNVKRVRIDLYRAANTLGELEREGKGLTGWEEAHSLRELLPKLESLKLKDEVPATGVNRDIGADR